MTLWWASTATTTCSRVHAASPPPPQTAMSVTSHEVGDLHLKVKTNTSRREGSSWRNERCEFLPLLVVPVQLQQADLVMQ